MVLSRHGGPDVLERREIEVADPGELFEKSVLAVARGGKIVTCGATAAFEARIDLRQI